MLIPPCANGSLQYQRNFLPQGKSAPHGCFPIRFKKATRSLALACGLFIYNAHTLIRYAHAHIRIMHSRLYGFLHVRLYGKMHSSLYI